MRVLQISADRSARGGLVPDTPASQRQEAYARAFGQLDDIGFSLRSDRFSARRSDALSVYPTNSAAKLFYGFDAIRIARRLLRPDIVTVQDPFETGLVGLIIARMLRVPLHVQVHTDFLSPEYARHSMLNRLRVVLAGFVLSRATGVRVVSDRIKASIEKKYQLSASITALPIFVDIEKFKNAQPMPGDAFLDAHQYKLLVVARNTNEKNIQLAVDAFRSVAPDNACLLITEEEDAIDALSENDKRIQTIHTMDPSRYYKSVDLVLVPSKYEGYGLVIVEALAAGKPVLSTDVGVAREAGAIVTTQEQFTDALKEWFDNGPREGHLTSYPYKSFNEYVEAYRADIAACVDR